MKAYVRIFQGLIVFVALLFMSSCSIQRTPQYTVIPTAVSSVSKTVYIEELNLTKDAYQIINTETAEAVIIYEKGRGGDFKITEQNNEFSLDFDRDDETQTFEIDYSGVVKCGYLSANDRGIDYSDPHPADFAKGLAAYRLINSVQEQGADGIIEPIVTMKVGQDGKKIIFTTTISAKLVKIKTK